MPSSELTSHTCVSHPSSFLSSHYEFAPVTSKDQGWCGHHRRFAFNVSLSVGCPTKGDLTVRCDFPKQICFSSASGQNPRRKGANSPPASPVHFKLYDESKAPRFRTDIPI